MKEELSTSQIFFLIVRKTIHQLMEKLLNILKKEMLSERHRRSLKRRRKRRKMVKKNLIQMFISNFLKKY